MAAVSIQCLLWVCPTYVLRVERILYIKFDYSLPPMNEYSNIRSTESDYQIWPSSVERSPEMGGESRMKSRMGEFDLTESIFCNHCIIHKR